MTRRLRPAWRNGLLAATLLLLAGCEAPAPVPYLRTIDEHTAATVTTARTPSVYYAEAPDLAVNARDYVSVWPFEVKENAVRRLYLACELWSTIDRQRVPGTPSLTLPAQVALRIDDIAEPLRVTGTDLRAVGLRRWPFPAAPHKGGQTVFLRVSKQQLRWLADARSATAIDLIAADGAAQTYALWRDERAALGEFLGDLP
jgi:hypothetical protein